jgi:serine phosphatase RsbU (regulator of sigma subunit)
VSTHDDGDLLAMLISLIDASHLVAFNEIPREVRRCAAVVGLEDVEIYLVDMQQEVLREMTGVGVDARQDAEREYAVDGTLAGRVFQYGQPEIGPRDDRGRFTCWVPLIKGTERLGVIRASIPEAGPGALRNAEHLASMTALVLLARRRSSDGYPRLLRTKQMGLAAEQEWQLLPPRTYADSRVVISGVMEPAYEVGGDAFDYAIAGDVAHLAVFDSMGHDTAAGIAANLAVATYRNRRRRDVPLAETSVEIERVLLEQFGGHQYVTGVIACLDTRDGTLTWVNRGHPAPIVIRGQRWSTSLKCPPAHPMGTDLGLEPKVCREQLEPGDRVVFYTDGIIEARNDAGEEFGLDQFIEFLNRHHSDRLPTPETLRRLVRSIMHHHGGKLDDDATVLLAERIDSKAIGARRLERIAGLPQH